MLRRLLTLIALCAGLAAVSEPARASGGAAEYVRLVEQAGSACALTVPAQAARAIALTSAGEREPSARLGAALAVVVPAVVLQADRAHE